MFITADMPAGYSIDRIFIRKHRQVLENKEKRFMEKIVQILMNVFIRRATLVALIAATGFLTACGPDTDQAAGQPPVT